MPPAVATSETIRNSPVQGPAYSRPCAPILAAQNPNPPRRQRIVCPCRGGWGCPFRAAAAARRATTTWPTLDLRAGGTLRHPSAMPDEIVRLRRLAEQAAADTPDVPALLSDAIRSAVAGSSNPWMVAGVLIEGLAHAVAAIPPERRKYAGLAAVRLLIDRLRVAGAG